MREVRVAEGPHLAAELALEAADELVLAQLALLEREQRVLAAVGGRDSRHGRAEVLEGDPGLALVRDERLEQRRGQDAAEVGDHRADHAASSGSSRARRS